MRKILATLAALLITAYLSMWFIGVHIVRGQLIDAINALNNDYKQITYSGINVGGFPFKLSFTLVEPRLKLSGVSVSEYETEEAKVSVSFSTRRISMLFDKNVTLKTQKYGAGEQEVYHLESSSNPEIALKLYEPLYKIVNNQKDRVSNVNSIKVKHFDLEISDKNGPAYIVKNCSIFLDSKVTDRDSVRDFHLTFDSDIYLTIDKQDLLSTKLDLDIQLNEKSTKFSLNDLYIGTKDVHLYSNGQINNELFGDLDGKISVSIKNYNALMVMLVESHLFPEDYAHSYLDLIKRLNSRDETVEVDNSENKDQLTYQKEDQDTKFDIIINKDGIKVGDIDIANLLNIH